jgi:preprotein translocase SecE subunit
LGESLGEYDEENELVTNATVKRGLFSSSRLFFKESIEELKKVSTPTRKEASQETLRALLLVVVFSVILAVLDWAFKALVWQVT